MAEKLRIGPGAELDVVTASEGVLEVRASYGGGASPPPAHYHPHQEERFEVLAGAMRTRIAGRDGEIAAGDVLEVPSGTVHQMWNERDEPAVLRWQTLPCGRTLEWFRELDAITRGETREDLLARFGDVFRLADA